MCETHAYDYAAFGRLIVPTALYEQTDLAMLSALARSLLRLLA